MSNPKDVQALKSALDAIIDAAKSNNTKAAQSQLGTAREIAKKVDYRSTQARRYRTVQETLRQKGLRGVHKMAKY